MTYAGARWGQGVDPIAFFRFLDQRGIQREAAMSGRIVCRSVTNSTEVLCRQVIRGFGLHTREKRRQPRQRMSRHLG